MVFHARFELGCAPICDWIINRPFVLPWCPSFVKSKILVSSTTVCFCQSNVAGFLGDPYDSAYQHHLPYSGFFGSLDQPLDQHLRICSARFRKWASVNCIEYLTPAGKLVCFFLDPKLYLLRVLPEDPELVRRIYITEFPSRIGICNIPQSHWFRIRISKF